MTTLALGPEWLSPDYLIETFSLPGILLIVFAESGLFAFLPGDSLLFTAGLFVAEGTFISQPLWLVCALIVLAAVLGDQVGYMIGKFFGPRLFSRPNSKLFKQENLEKAHEFMEKFGPKAIVLARFVPIVRTFAPIVAGSRPDEVPHLPDVQRHRRRGLGHRRHPRSTTGSARSTPSRRTSRRSWS